MHDGPGRARDRFESALDQFLPALDQHLHRHVLWYQVFFDDVAHELVVGQRRRRKANLDFFDADPDQCLEKDPAYGPGPSGL